MAERGGTQERELTEVNLKSADLTDANLTRASLAGALLTGVNQSGTDFTRANLTDICYYFGAGTRTPTALPAHWAALDGYPIGPTVSLYGGADLADANPRGDDWPTPAWLARTWQAPTSTK